MELKWIDLKTIQKKMKEKNLLNKGKFTENFFEQEKENFPEKDI